jgi:hypothetical protein
MIGRLGNHMTCYGFRVYAFLFVLQQNRRDRRFLSPLYRGVAARRQLDAITLRLQSSFAKLQHLWTVVDAQQSRGVHGHTLRWALSRLGGSPSQHTRLAVHQGTAMIQTK